MISLQPQRQCLQRGRNGEAVGHLGEDGIEHIHAVSEAIVLHHGTELHIRTDHFAQLGNVVPYG